ncbi:hypothetical protein L202_02199 [Cryptococcus amylolentus CBS 6039]|uniref:Uncharacterized protein n=1 Tax=Cryptococcus amylolentus CBS 6039 TaxID=1295533 RepID=A0A1E3I0H9_9TREE|nr:hypothetical protein L202_02199 [Cryptococcus amylolentus CBS 6039]ODN81835.1 hypothetical protein L202_02199 [Cryptococcus amylolentus CBS 6039]
MLEGTDTLAPLPPPSTTAPSPLQSLLAAQTATVSHQIGSVAPRQHGSKTLSLSQKQMTSSCVLSDESWYARGLINVSSDHVFSFKCAPCSLAQKSDVMIHCKNASRHTKDPGHVQGLFSFFLKQEGKKVENDIEIVRSKLAECMEGDVKDIDWMKGFADRIQEVLKNKPAWQSMIQQHIDHSSSIYYHCSACSMNTGSSPHLEISVGLLIRHLRDADHIQRVPHKDAHDVCESNASVPYKPECGLSPPTSIPAALPQSASASVPSSPHADLPVPGTSSLDLDDDAPINIGESTSYEPSDPNNKGTLEAFTSSLLPRSSSATSFSTPSSSILITPKASISVLPLLPLLPPKSLTHYLNQHLKRPSSALSDREASCQQRPRLVAHPSSGGSEGGASRPALSRKGRAEEEATANKDLMNEEVCSGSGTLYQQALKSGDLHIKEIERRGEKLMAAFKGLFESGL